MCGRTAAFYYWFLFHDSRPWRNCASRKKKLESNDSNRDNGYDTFHERVPGSSKYNLKQPVLDWINNFKNGELSEPDITVTEMKTVGKILQDDILVPDYTK